jgi:hypothetical protein
VLDFDQVIADPNNPHQQNPAYDGDGTHLNVAGRIAEGNYVAQSTAGNTQGHPNIWKFRAPIPYQPILGLNPSNGMDFSPDAQREVGTYIILPSIGTLASSKYRFFFSSALLSVTPAPLQVSANNKTVTYGSPLPGLDGTLTGALPADNITAAYSTSATSSSLPGSYPITPALVDPKNRLSNYIVAQTSGILTIVPPPPPPTIGRVAPAYTAAGGPGFTLTLTGSGFPSDSVVHWAGNALAAQFVSSTSLSAQVPASAIAKNGTADITVQGSQAGEGSSNLLLFEIDSNAGTGYSPVFATLTATVPPGSSAAYPVTLPLMATNVSVSCLNLPVGATCSYSSVAAVVTVTTSSSTPAGNYQIVVVFTETLPQAPSALVAFPVFLIPLAGIGRQRRPRHIALLALLLLATMFIGASGCGGTSGAPPPPSQQQVTSSGTVTLNVQ